MLRNAADYWDEVEDFFKNGVWKFTDAGTVIQCDMVDGKPKWYLSYSNDGREPYYWLPIEPTHKSILFALNHLSEKNWVQIDAVFNAMLPAIRAVLWKQ